MVLDAQGQPQKSLAKSITPNNDGTEWTIVIPDGVTTHRGKPFTADDVLFSFNRIVSNKYPGASSLGPDRPGVVEGGQSDDGGVEVLAALRDVAGRAAVGVLHDGSA